MEEDGNACGDCKWCALIAAAKQAEETRQVTEWLLNVANIMVKDYKPPITSDDVTNQW